MVSAHVVKFLLRFKSFCSYLGFAALSMYFLNVNVHGAACRGRRGRRDAKAVSPGFHLLGGTELAQKLHRRSFPVFDSALHRRFSAEEDATLVTRGRGVRAHIIAVPASTPLLHIQRRYPRHDQPHALLDVKSCRIKDRRDSVKSQVSPAISHADSATSGQGAALRFRVQVSDLGSLM